MSETMVTSKTSWRPRHSLRAKLTASVFALTLLIVLTLSLSFGFLFTADKRTYVYKSQTTQAVLAGKDFVNSAKHHLQTLKIALATTNLPGLQALVENQSGLTTLLLGKFSSTASELEINFQANKSGTSPRASPIQRADLALAINDLRAKGFALVNLSVPAGERVLGVLVTDGPQPTADPLPFALGTFPLESFFEELGGVSLTIAAQDGRVLFDTDSKRFYGQGGLSGEPLFEFAKSSTAFSSVHEYEGEQGRIIASIVRPGLDLFVFSQTPWDKALQAVYQMSVKFALIGLGTLGLGIVFAVIFSHTLTAPLKRLFDATREIARGNFSIQLTPSSQDEIGGLALSFNTMSAEIQNLIQKQIQEQVSKTQLEAEVAIASAVQQTLIPAALVRGGQFEIHSHYRSATQCGGDWWGYFESQDRLYVAIADATGHGIPSALITASARSCFSTMQKLVQGDPQLVLTPSDILEHANRVVFDASMGKIMMTFFVAIFDFKTGQLSYSSAGHNPPWLFRKEAGSFKLDSLVTPGERLGEKPDGEGSFQTKVKPFGPGDILFLYTDGLTEGMNSDGEMYGKKRLRKSIESLLNGPLATAVDRLVNAFLEHNGPNKPLDDDITVAIVQIAASEAKVG